MTVDDPYDLERFVAAQDDADVFSHAIDELRRGHKASHWMWFVFPQIAGLGHSAMASRFAISSLEEAQAYVRHPILGHRLIECASIVADAEGRTAEEIFGGVDAVKLRSSMTLFIKAAPDDVVFQQVLDKYFAGVADPITRQRI